MGTFNRVLIGVICATAMEIGFTSGKHSADRWYAAHPVQKWSPESPTVTLTDKDGNEETFYRCSIEPWANKP